MEPRVCMMCGRDIGERRKDAITCSPKCRQKMLRWRRADTREAIQAIQTLEMLTNALENPYFRENAGYRIQQIFQAAQQARFELERFDYQMISGAVRSHE